MKNEALRLGKNLSRIRKEKKITQADIAKAVGFSCSYLSNIENGKVNATLSTVAKLAMAIEVSMEELIK